jgi:protein-arginine kinase activator protein McsA
MPMIQKVCPGCRKQKRFSKSFVERTNPDEIRCRPCYKAAFGVSRPIVGREKVRKPHASKKPAAQKQQQPKRKRG